MQTLRNIELDASRIAWPQHMQRAIQLAASVFSAAPNPRVGCVIVGGSAEAGDSVLGEGWHKGAGLPHAEPEAIADVIRLAAEPLGQAAMSDSRLAPIHRPIAGSIAFVTLEPCCHSGRTGPCSSALIEAGVSRVVIASQDPNPKVSGGGIAALEAAGVEVFFFTGLRGQRSAIESWFFQ